MRNVIIYGINWTNCMPYSLFLSKYPESALKRVTH